MGTGSPDSVTCVCAVCQALLHGCDVVGCGIVIPVNDLICRRNIICAIAHAYAKLSCTYIDAGYSITGRCGRYYVRCRDANAERLGRKGNGIILVVHRYGSARYGERDVVPV